MLGLRKRDLTSQFVYLLYVGLGIYFILQRQQALMQITVLLSMVMIVGGLWGLVLGYINRNKEDAVSMVTPTISLVFGLVLLIFRTAATGIIPFCIGLWALLMGVVKLIICVQYFFSKEPRWWTQLPEGIVRLGLGIAILFNVINLNAVFAVLVGVYLIAFGVFNIGEYIACTVIDRKKRR